MIDMEKLLAITMAVLLIFSMTACQSTGQISCPAEDEPDPVNAPGSNGASKPTSMEPPALKILDSSGMAIEANIGTYSWIYDNGDGTQTGICADSSHPLEWQEFLIPLSTSDPEVEFYFDVEPQEFTIRCWSDTYWGQTDAKEEKMTVNGNKLELKQGGYIYEVVAKWTGENLAAEGTAYYAFYVIQDDHSHMLAEQSQTVDDPVTGYCGNTMTTIVVAGKEFTFMGSDSVNLTDILINLKYDPMRVCRCTPEFTVKTEFGDPYAVNLSKGYARCEEGQADLTPDQIKLIQLILENQI